MNDCLAKYHDINAMDASIGLMHWDRQILMPPGGTKANLTAVSHLVGIRNRMYRDPALRSCVQEVLDTTECQTTRRMAEVFLKKIDREVKIPSVLTERKSAVSAMAYSVWRQARAESNFAPMVPHYRELIEIAREIADVIAVTDTPYDSLMDQYEPEARVADVDQLFATIEGPLVELRSQILSEQTAATPDVLARDWDQAKLMGVAREITKAVGFDFSRGRLDIGPNSFCTSADRSDVRMSSRPNSHIRGILSSSLHEMGHGLYEQNISPEYQQTPLGGGISLAVHESQSRLWENVIGRHPAFWQSFFPRLSQAFPELASLGAGSFASMYSRVNTSPIRVGSDELSYNLHILIRYQLEVALINGELEVEDLPGAWNEKYQKYLGITPPSDAEGVLQDVHWSRGSFGYFPTYAMGNIMSGQIWQTMNAELDAPELIASGNFAPILGWLTEKIYASGQFYTSRQLMTNLCGSYMDTKPWLAYVADRFTNAYEA